MIEGDAVALAGQHALWTALLLAGPLLGLLLVIGLAVAVLQALTQVQEAALAFVPKLLVLGAAMLFGGPLAMAVMRGFTETLFARIATLGLAG
jgi:flagellar biosynthetic protein FliQ